MEDESNLNLHFSNSSADDHHQFTMEEELNIVESTNSLPYQALLHLIRVLTKNHETSSSSSIPCEGVSGTWRYNFEFTPYIGHEFWAIQWELILQQMVFKLLQNHGVMSEVVDDIRTVAELEAEPVRLAAQRIVDSGELFRMDPSYYREWESCALNFLKAIDQKIKPLLKEFCLGIVNGVLKGDPFSSSLFMGFDISEFIHIILLKLKDVRVLKPYLIAPVKKQMQTLEQLLHLACVFCLKSKNHEKNSSNFLVNFQIWLNIAASLVILCWVDENDEGLLALVSSSFENFNLSIPQLVEVYVSVIKVLKPSNVSEMLLMREIVSRFIDIVLQNLNVFAGDRFEMFQEGLALCVALFMNPPQADAEDDKLICAEINLLVGKAESLVPSLCLKKMAEDISEEMDNLLSDFIEMIYKAKEEVGKLHLQVPGFSWKNVPETNTRGHFDFLLENLQKKTEAEAGLFPFEKHLITIVHKELSLLRPSLMDIFELQDEHSELRDIFVRASNMAYLVDYVTDLCLSSTDIPIWSNLMHLSDAIEKIQFIKTEVSKIRHKDQLYKNIAISAKLNYQIVLPGRQEAYATIRDDFKVGFIEDEQRLIDYLVAGDVERDIVALVGMPGQGKTYLARRTFQDTRIKHYFDKLSWCCISQAYDIKKVFVDILEGVGHVVSPELCQSLSQGDLGFQLRRCLSGQRYLVVLDDMWDAKIWCDLNLSFPDDNNGSRILITSRNRNVALEVKANCSIIELYPLSDNESWSLLSMKIFHGDSCPPTLSDIGKTIAKNCKGLPLAIVVVAGLLKKGKNVQCWKQISESLKLHIASEGCMDILELSYKHLPDYLKPCFLYLGAFREDEIIDAKQLIRFWIAEGFVQSDGMKAREVVAREYLMDLVSRSLVFIAQRSSRNGIKKCHIHDLFHQLCLIKIQEERFLLVPDICDYSSTQNNDHWRISVHDKWEHFFNSKPVIPGMLSLHILCNTFFAPYINGFLKDFKLLRVLDLNNVIMIVNQSGFDEITQLIHLRHLTITCGFPIPPSITNLVRLEVLHCYPSSSGFFLPSVVIKMTSLRHIFVSPSNCFEYVEDFDKMVPELSSPLTNLETLSTIFLKDELSFKRVAQRLSNLLKFGIRCPFCVRLSSYFKKLESLTLCITMLVDINSEAISPSILDFPLSLKKLNLTVWTKLSGGMISSIGKLSNLEVLKLRANFNNNIWEVEDDEFLRLKYLEFKFSYIQEWNVSDESFPCLEQIIVRRCRSLRELSARFGSVITLRRIELKDCKDNLRNSFQQIVDDQMDAGNECLQYSFS